MADYLFQPVIENWKTWGEIFCSISAFFPLIREIFQKEKLVLGEIQNLTPGTNAVFRCGNYVIKIYAPAESGLDCSRDFYMEKTLLHFAAKLGIAAPNYITSGEFCDKYRFPYLIMDYAEGTEGGTWLKNCTVRQKKAAVRQLKKLLERLHQPACELPPFPAADIKRRALENPRLQQLSAPLAEEIKRRIGAVAMDNLVLVHGDITGENVLVTPDGKPMLIDFADACIAPSCYELPPLLIELFRFEPQLVREWIGSTDFEPFLDQFIDGLALHDFGPDLIQTFLDRQGIPVSAIHTLRDLRNIFSALLLQE